MKKLFLGMFAIVAMASCSENEVILDGTQKTIGFAPAQFGNSIISRATTTELGKTIKLGVYAYQTAGNPTALYIDDVLSCSSDVWKLSQTYYWPAENPELAFYAYGPYDAAGATGITNPACAIAGTPTFDYAVTGTAPSQTDVIVDLAGKTVNKTTVTFNLSHVLTQVMFQAKLSTSPNTALTVKIVSIKVKAPASAKFAIASSAAKWSGHAAANTEYTVVGTESAAITTASTTVGTTLNMIPSSAAVIEVVANAYNKSTHTKVGSKTITIKCDGTPAPNVAEWKAGTKVTYTLTLDPDKIASGDGSEESGSGGTAIEFGQPTVNEWTTGTGDISM